MESSVGKASIVVLAEVVSSEQHPTGPNSSAIAEDVIFRVIDPFKGPSRRGDLLRTRSILGPSGPCGISVKNSPVWLESTVNGKPRATKLSGLWVIYGTEKQPFELSQCGPSVAMEAGGGGVLRQIRALLKPKKAVR